MATGSMLPRINLDIDYDEDRRQISDFLRFFKAERGSYQGPVLDEDAASEDDEQGGDDADNMYDEEMEDAPRRRIGRRRDGRPVAMVSKYMIQMQKIANREQDSIVIDLADVAKHRNTNDDTPGTALATAIRNNTRRYVDIFCECVDKEMPEPTVQLNIEDEVLDVLMSHRRDQNARVAEGANAEGGLLEESTFPPILTRRYHLYFKPDNNAYGKSNADSIFSVRKVRGVHLGKLITVRGIVTRVSDVKPLLVVDAYSCDLCGSETFQEIQARQYMPLAVCTSRQCTMNNTKGTLHPQTRACKFVPFQEVKIQEMADQVPVGHIPRSMTIHMYGPITRTMNPGDVVHAGGIFLPMPYTGFKAIRSGLLTDTYLESQHIHQVKKQYNKMELTEEMKAEVINLSGQSEMYDRLASSIAPEIFGHEDVKKVLLLLLVGGVTKEVGDGMKIRGDINVCLMGDPGVAKSQLLKYISKVAPRGVYTTGRGSSGVGLTAAVMRDPVTDEMVLEGGALVLADNGIACIDEFDKMEDSDRTAIHEVMEQQTISISKAGITTTLNARTSILAAANPLYGRYNPRVSPVDNINLPAALLSRFDILFLILDTPGREHDERLAQHVTFVHMHSTPPESDMDPIDPNVMRHYIAMAREKRPTVPRHVSDYVVSAYVQMRAQHKEDEEREQAYTYTSARTLLGILRLSQALARLRLKDEVVTEDVDEALRLIDVSKASLHTHRKGADEGHQDQTYVSKIYRIIREMAVAANAARTEAADRRSRQARGRGGARGATRGRIGRGPQRERGGRGGSDDSDSDMDVFSDDEDTRMGADTLPELQIREIRDRVIASGFVEDQLQETLQEYQDLGIIQITGARLMFVDQ